MPRKPRIHAPGAVYHVMLRGNDRQDIFYDDQDRFRLYSILNISNERFHHRILAFCLMKNHIHLEIQVGDVFLSRIMQKIAQRYTQWSNWRHNKTGHVFEGRYKAVMVDVDEYLLELAAYIHLNPVRAKVTTLPEKYRWSSHRAYLGKESLPWLETDFILSQFSSNVKKARASFAAYVKARIEEERRKEFHGEKTIDNRIFGDDYFVANVLAEADTAPLLKPGVEVVLSIVKKLYTLSDERLRAQGRDRLTFEARALAAWATLEFSSGTLTELARYLGRNSSTMTCAVRRIEKLRDKNPQLAEKMERLRQELTILSYQGLSLSPLSPPGKN